MNLRKLYFLMLILPIMFFNQACSDDDNTTEPVEVINEAQLAAEYVELNVTIQKMMTADAVNSLILTSPEKVYVMDIRSATDYANGHIKDAVNVALKDIVTHYKTNNLQNKENVVIACYTGQTAGYATAMLRMLGYSNVADLKWGMCSWNEATATGWKSATNVNNNYVTQLVTTVTAKNAAGELPKLETGKKVGPEVIEARVNALLATADPFGDAKVGVSTVWGNLTGYYIVNYWSAADYAWGHIPGAIQYSPSPSDFFYSTALKTLPTNKTIAVYCYTGQTSAHMAAYLRVLGYDAKSVLFGVNGMAHDTMPANKWADTEIKGFELYK